MTLWFFHSVRNIYSPKVVTLCYCFLYHISEFGGTQIDIYTQLSPLCILCCLISWPGQIVIKYNIYIYISPFLQLVTSTPFCCLVAWIQLIYHNNITIDNNNNILEMKDICIPKPPFVCVYHLYRWKTSLCCRGVWHSCPTTRNEAVDMGGMGSVAGFLYLQLYLFIYLFIYLLSEWVS